jgi:16S rRNA (uracil1498-N3)-methyltransferase
MGTVEVTPPAKLTDLHPVPGAVSLFLHTEPIAFHTLHGYLDRVPERVELAIGPEGGFSPSEVTLLTERGFRPLHLGQRVLRTESAALFALGAVQILIQERHSWQLVR